MDLNRTYEIISALAAGHNPYTGEVFTNDSVFQNPDTVRALYTVLELISIRIKTGNRKSSLPENAGKNWEEEEVFQLIKEFDQGMNIADMAKTHARTTWGVRQKLVKLGKIQY